MTKHLVPALSLFIAAHIYGQGGKSFELDIIGRYDKQADYTTRYFGRSYTNDTRLWGKSYGFNFNFSQPIYKNLKFKIVIGYYRLGIDKIRQTTPFNTIATGRNLDYQHPSGIALLFATNKYWYNNLSINGGFSYGKKLSKTLDFATGADFGYLYTFSQVYNVRYGGNIRYKTKNAKILGFGINSYTGVIIKSTHGKYYINPKIIIPVYQKLNGDEVFGENDKINTSKWFNGVGVSVAVGKYF
jgi:hypothetical protein